MRVLVVYALAVAFVAAKPQQGSPEEHSVIRALRQPFTDIPLKTLFRYMNDPSTVQFYVDCITETGPCDSVGNAIQNLIYDQQRVGQFCQGCTKCDRERIQYVFDILKTDYKKMACKIQKKLRINLFGSINPCTRDVLLQGP